MAAFYCPWKFKQSFCFPRIVILHPPSPFSTLTKAALQQRQKKKKFHTWNRFISFSFSFVLNMQVVFPIYLDDLYESATDVHRIHVSCYHISVFRTVYHPSVKLANHSNKQYIMELAQSGGERILANQNWLWFCLRLAENLARDFFSQSQGGIQKKRKQWGWSDTQMKSSLYHKFYGYNVLLRLKLTILCSLFFKI